MSDFDAPISETIWNMKYRFKEADGTPIDQTLDDTWWRVAHALAEAEKAEDRGIWADQFFTLLNSGEFVPAGRIIAGAGTGRAVTLFNCYVMGTIPDSMDGIFTHLREAALTMQQGGGIGYDFSTLRPKGALVKGVAADASGPLTFMDVWDAMCRTVMSAGSRRGAMMATMRCDHPDIEAFIEAKQDPARLRMFNLSVLVTDAFMEAVKNNAPWRLHFEDRNGETLMERTVSARGLWDKIMRGTYSYAEPGVLFIDRINAANNLRYCEKISASNPCGEQVLPPYGACLLGSINLAKMVRNPFTLQAKIDFEAIEKATKLAVRMMDNVNDVSKFPLWQQAEESRLKRRIGLGMTGLADMLAMMRIPYDSDEGEHIAEDIMRRLTLAAYWASVDIAKEKGAFPALDADMFLEDGTLASRLPEDLKAAIRKYGIRNSHLTSIAPTGTISLFSGNVSSGIEPIFAFSYERKVLQPDGSKTTELVEDYAVKAYREWWLSGVDAKSGLPNQPEEWSNDLLPNYFVSAQTLSPEAHVRMQAAAQKWVDSSISKTVNVPEDISFEDFKAVYQLAYDLGCKGCTTYRPNDITGSILSVAETPKAEPEAQAETQADTTVQQPTLPLDQPTERPDELLGTTYKLKWPGNPHAIYLTVNDIVEDGKRRPFEVFIASKNMDNYAWTVALTRMVSAIFRRPHDSSFVAQELKAVFDPAGGGWVKGKFVPSVLALIGETIERHMQKIGYIPTEGPFGTPSAAAMHHFTKVYHDGQTVVTEKQEGNTTFVRALTTGGATVGGRLEDDMRQRLHANFGLQSAPIAPQLDGFGFTTVGRKAPDVCPKCFSTDFKNEGGCRTCLTCGDSKCS